MYRICFDLTRRNSDKPTLKLARSEGINRLSSAGCHGNEVSPNHKDLISHSKLCLNPGIFTGLKEPEHQEKYISLPEKTEEMI